MTGSRPAGRVFTVIAALALAVVAAVAALAIVLAARAGSDEPGPADVGVVAPAD